MRKPVFMVSILIVCLAAGLLISGSDILVVSLNKGFQFPAGTLITWLGISFLPIALRSSFRELWQREGIAKWYSHGLTACLTLSIFWGICSYLLSGKWNFAFSGSSPTFVGSAEAGELFWIMTKFMVGVPILMYLLFLVHSAWLKLIR